MIKINCMKTDVVARRIQAYNKEYLAKKIAQINKKAVKLGCEPMVLRFGPEKIEEGVDVNGKKTKMVTCLAVLKYKVPVIDGWKLICRFDAVDGKKGIVVFTSAVPGEIIPAKYNQKNSIECDHCKQKRFRNHSILMQHIETGEYKEVGSTCIKDFFGHDPKRFMIYASFSFGDIVLPEKEDDFYHYNGQSYHPIMDELKPILSMTAACIDEFGWISGSLAYRENLQSTSSHVIEQLNPPLKKYRGWIDVEITDEHKKLADETIEYFSNLDPKEIAENDYMMNCWKLTQAEVVPWKKVGTAVSMVNTYKRATQEAIKKSERKKSNYVGEIGEKIETHVKCIYETVVESYYGTSHLYIFMDDAGNILKTFYSGTKWDMAKDETGILKGTVKKHDKYKGEKNTMLTRCNVSDIKAPEIEKA